MDKSDGYYKDSTLGESTPTLQELKAALVQRHRVRQTVGKSPMKVVNLQTELGASDADLRLFAKRLTIHIGPEYEEHKRSVVAELKTTMGMNAVVAEEHLYPTALSLVTGLAAQNTLAKRRTTKAQFCAQLMPSRTLLSAWLLYEQGDCAFCREMRQRHFSRQNIDAVNRFFLVDCTRPVSDDDLLGVLHTLRRKWSSHTVRRKPDAERYAPYVYFRGLTDDRLITLKASLQGDAIGFVDGYAFAGADFSADHVSTRQTYANGVSLRFLNHETDLAATLPAVKGTSCIYDFFLDTPLNLRSDVRYIAIPVNSIPMIERII